MNNIERHIVVSIHIAESTYKAFKVHCVQAGESVRAMTKKVIDEFIKNNPSSKKKKAVKKD